MRRARAEIKDFTLLRKVLFYIKISVCNSGFSVWTDHEGFRQFQRVINGVGVVLCKLLAVKEISPVPHRVYRGPSTGLAVRCRANRIRQSGAVKVGNRALQLKVLPKMAPPDLRYLGQHRFVTFVDRWMEILRKLSAKLCRRHSEHNFDLVNRFLRFKKAYFHSANFRRNDGLRYSSH